MNDLAQKIQFSPELQDQIELLQKVLKKIATLQQRISSVNSGFMCFASHANSLKSNLESEDAIDQALRTISAVLAIKQIIFNVNVEYLK